ncbi:hypothetical protein NO1_0312 [Candidatus Termititenax aidoneus]|uniref:Uncharacterized protein n=1 Tax=Termititenax aidoneus TaxID=2218524 RepID=A0A388T9D2_TERA1|nr:hypothetical protein NO1_0312 [Candidatus Termititenax aidoneus]
MRKLFLVLLAVLMLCGGCLNSDSAMPLTKLTNELTSRRILVLTKKSAYTVSFLQQLHARAGAYYSLIIDDLNNLPEYNFAEYNGVLLIETLVQGGAPELDELLEVYSGANNIVLHGLDDEYTSPHKISVVTANSQNLDAAVLENTAEQIYFLLRSK